MKNFKKLLIVLLSLTLVFAMIGCGGSNEPADGENEESGSEKIRRVY